MEDDFGELEERAQDIMKKMKEDTKRMTENLEGYGMNDLICDKPYCAKSKHAAFKGEKGGYCSISCLSFCEQYDNNEIQHKEKMERESASNIQEGGNHYKNYAIEPIDFVHANDLSYIQGNVIKYIVRYKDKNGLEDLKKAKHYIDLLIEREYGEA